MMLRNYVEECIDIVADALEPIVTEKIPEIDSNDVRALFKAIVYEHWNVFEDVVGWNNRSRVHELLHIGNIIFHKKRDTGLDTGEVRIMFGSSISLLASVNAKDALAKVESLRNKFEEQDLARLRARHPDWFGQQIGGNRVTVTRIPNLNVRAITKKENKRIKPPRPEGVSDFCLPPFYPCKLDDKSIKIAEELVALAKTEKTITYGELGSKVVLEPCFNQLSVRLGGISWVTHHNTDVLLSVLVINAQKNAPGDGFFNLARKLNKTLCLKLDDAIFSDALNRVYEAAKAGKLDFILTGETFND